MDRLIVLCLVAVVYVARPYSCLIARSIAPDEAAGFDFDGTKAGFGILLALLFTVPVLRIAFLILRRPGGILPPAGTRTPPVGVQAVVWAALAAPTYAQLEHLAALPPPAAAAIVVACVAWAIVTAILWALARRRAAILAAIGRSALVVGGLTALPKLLLLPSLLVPGG